MRAVNREDQEDAEVNAQEKDFYARHLWRRPLKGPLRCRPSMDSPAALLRADQAGRPGERQVRSHVRTIGMGHVYVK
jgi:hypothetical protein